MARIFTPEEANRTIPELKKILTEIQALKDELEASSENSRQEASIKLKQLAGRLESVGCLVRDISIGLVDFPAFRLGRPVFLCWKLGEPSVQYWHGDQEGYLGRKSIVLEEFQLEAPIPAYIV